MILGLNKWSEDQEIEASLKLQTPVDGHPNLDL